MRLIWFPIAFAAITGCVRHVNRYPSSIEPVRSPEARIGIEGFVETDRVAAPPGVITGRTLYASVSVPHAMVISYEARCGQQTYGTTVGTTYEEFYAAELTRRQLAWDEAQAERERLASEAPPEPPPPPPPPPRPARPARGQVRVQVGPLQGSVQGSVQVEGHVTVAPLVPGIPPRPTALPADVTGATTYPFEFFMGNDPGECTFVVRADEQARRWLGGSFHVVTHVDRLPDRAGQATRLRGGMIAQLEAQGARTPPVVVAVAPHKPVVVTVAPPKPVTVAVAPPKPVTVTVAPPRPVTVTVAPPRPVAVDFEAQAVLARKPHAISSWRAQAIAFTISSGADPNYRVRLHEAEEQRKKAAAAVRLSVRRAEEAHAEASLAAGATFHRGLIAHLRASGARERPALPALLAEARSPAPAEHSEWINGEWVFNEQAWQWEWRRGFWRTRHIALPRTTVSVHVQHGAPPPPPVLAETPPPPPHPGAVWVAGSWAWIGGQWQWRRGHWVTAQAELRIQVPNVNVQIGTKP